MQRCHSRLQIPAASLRKQPPLQYRGRGHMLNPFIWHLAQCDLGSIHAGVQFWAGGCPLLLAAAKGPYWADSRQIKTRESSQTKHWQQNNTVLNRLGVMLPDCLLGVNTTNSQTYTLGLAARCRSGVMLL